MPFPNNHRYDANAHGEMYDEAVCDCEECSGSQMRGNEGRRCRHRPESDYKYEI